MALIKCSECKKEISNKAPVCPHCGFAKPKPTQYGCGTVILGLFIVAIFMGIYDDSTTPAEPTKPKTAAELRADQLKPAFSAWDGSHINLEKYIKKSLKDPDSYEHITTKYVDNGDHLIVYTNYRAKNSFGGYVVNTAKATAKIDGTLITAEIGN